MACSNHVGHSSANGHGTAGHPLLLACASRLLPLLDPDPDRVGLADTPRRFAQAMEGSMKGYQQDPAAILRSALFHESACWSGDAASNGSAGGDPSTCHTNGGAPRDCRSQALHVPPSSSQCNGDSTLHESEKASHSTAPSPSEHGSPSLPHSPLPPAGEGGGSGGLVLVQGVQLFSSCAFCLLPLRLACHAAYVPARLQVVGLSKLPRAAQALARRRQCAHSLAASLARAVQEAVQPAGCYVVVQAQHLVGLEGAVTGEEDEWGGEREGREEGYAPEAGAEALNGEAAGRCGRGKGSREHLRGWAMQGGRGFAVASAATGCMAGAGGQGRRQEALALIGVAEEEVEEVVLACGLAGREDTRWHEGPRSDSSAFWRKQEDSEEEQGVREWGNSASAAGGAHASRAGQQEAASASGSEGHCAEVPPNCPCLAAARAAAAAWRAPQRAEQPAAAGRGASLCPALLAGLTAAEHRSGINGSASGLLSGAVGGPSGSSPQAVCAAGGRREQLWRKLWGEVGLLWPSLAGWLSGSGARGPAHVQRWEEAGGAELPKASAGHLKKGAREASNGNGAARLPESECHRLGALVGVVAGLAMWLQEAEQEGVEAVGHRGQNGKTGCVESGDGPEAAVLLLQAATRLVAYLLAGTESVREEWLPKHCGSPIGALQLPAREEGEDCSGTLPERPTLPQAPAELANGCGTGALHARPLDLRVPEWHWDCCNLSLASLCEHHLLPFFGEVRVACVWQQRAAWTAAQHTCDGVQCCSAACCEQGRRRVIRQVCASIAKKLQVQERITRAIGEQVHCSLGCDGVLVVIRAHHLCMTGRGALQPGSTTSTLATLGVIAEQSQLRLLAMKLIGQFTR